MGMPALSDRRYFGAHSLKSLKRDVFGFCGIRPIRTRRFGMAGSASDARRRRWLMTMCGHGHRAR
jgi:hypothetical protein